MAQPDIQEPLPQVRREELRRWFVGQTALFRGMKVRVLDIDLWRRAFVEDLAHPGEYRVIVRLSDLHFEPQAVFPASAPARPPVFGPVADR